MSWWDVLGKIDDVAGILGMIVTFLVGLGLRRTHFKFKQWLYRFKNGAVISNGYVMIVGNEGTKKDVRDFLNSDSQLKTIHEDAICLVPAPENFTPENRQQYLDEFIKQKEATKKHAAQDIMHLFVQAPVVIGESIGSYLFNKGDTYIYQKAGSTYICYGLLNTRGVQPGSK